MEGVLYATEVARILSRLTEEGWIFPVRYGAISKNGSMVLGRYWKPSEAGETIVSHCPSGEIVLPMNMMLVDERGQTALIKWLSDTEAVIVTTMRRNDMRLAPDHGYGGKNFRP